MRGLSEGVSKWRGLGESSGITWSCSEWRHAPIPGVSVVRGTLPVPSRWICDGNLTPEQLTASGVV